MIKFKAGDKARFGDFEGHLLGDSKFYGGLYFDVVDSPNFNSDGSLSGLQEFGPLLVMVQPAPESRKPIEGWVNIYEGDAPVGSIFDTKEIARAAALGRFGYITTVKICEVGDE